MTIKPLESHYYSTVLRTVMAYYQGGRRHRETEFFLEYQNCNLWFDLPEPPIFGKFDFLKEMK
jgi:hypothetical protein